MRYVWAVCIAVCFPITAHAQVLITEIMYAPEGADAKHEWIEVCNTGTSSVSLEDWTFFENDTNHTLKVVSGSATLSAGACAVIADHPDTFTSDYRSYAGTLFDSAFSLKNTGEYLALHDNTEALIDEVGYSDADGGKDNGLSLHRDGIIFQEGVPSPGAYGSGGIVTESNAEKNEGILSDHVTLYSYESVLIEPPEDVYIRMPDTIITTAGAITPFTIESFEATGRVVKDGYIHWSFGDGAEGYGREVSHQYLYEGTYTVSVTLERDTLFDTKRVVVHVVPFDAFMYVDPDGAWVGIRNNSTYDLDISEWRIMSLGQYFRIPRTTIIAAESEVRFPTVITKLSTLSMTKEAQLVFPDGKIALVGKVVQVEEEPIALVATTT